MRATLLERPSAVLPLVMSLAALAVVMIHAASFGTAPEPDEGTAAHLWQLLMAGQVPFVAFFAVRWVPADPKRAFGILALQIAAAVSAMFPVWWFQW